MQTEIDNHSDVVVGADNVIEIAAKYGGTVRSWVCTRCVCICSSTDQLLSHLSSFDHIDNVMVCICQTLFHLMICLFYRKKSIPVSIVRQVDSIKLSTLYAHVILIKNRVSSRMHDNEWIDRVADSCKRIRAIDFRYQKKKNEMRFEFFLTGLDIDRSFGSGRSRRAVSDG